MLICLKRYFSRGWTLFRFVSDYLIRRVRSRPIKRPLSRETFKDEFCLQALFFMMDEFMTVIAYRDKPFNRLISNVFPGVSLVMNLGSRCTTINTTPVIPP
jgi:hypothetical protein